MEPALTLDSTFLVDLERECTARREGAAHRLLEQQASAALLVSMTVPGDLACGRTLAARERWEWFLAPFRLLPIDARTAWEYGRAFRFLSANGVLLGANDLWIAATALAHDLPLVTRNTSEFQRVPSLRLIGY